MCQQCRRSVGLTYWVECDDADEPTPVFVVLCKGCADKIIEPHPRLYREQALDTPMPGVMPICADCLSRKGLRCLSPVAMFNGGPDPGLLFEPKGSMVHICRSPRRLSGWHYLMPGPVTSCNGKAPAEVL